MEIVYQGFDSLFVSMYIYISIMIYMIRLVAIGEGLVSQGLARPSHQFLILGWLINSGGI